MANSGWPRFGSVRLPFAHGTVRAVPVSVPTVPLGKGILCISAAFEGNGTVPVPVSVPEKWFRRFRSVPGKTVSTVVVYGSVSVPVPSYKLAFSKE